MVKLTEGINFGLCSFGSGGGTCAEPFLDTTLAHIKRCAFGSGLIGTWSYETVVDTDCVLLSVSVPEVRLESEAEPSQINGGREEKTCCFEAVQDLSFGGMEFFLLNLVKPENLYRT